MKIYKYLLNHGIINEPQVVKMPYGARLLKVDNQRGACVVWAEVHLENDEENRIFYIAYTGSDVPLHSRYVGTFQDGGYVFHVYDSTQHQPMSKRAS